MDKYDKAAIRIVWGESAARWRRYESDHPAFAKEIAAVMREVASVKWQPIDSAPRDGARILVSGRLADDRTWVYGIAEWRDEFGKHVEPGSLTVGWTHWLPLPPPPGDQGR